MELIPIPSPMFPVNEFFVIDPEPSALTPAAPFPTEAFFVIVQFEPSSEKPCPPFA